jgi:hypothetical protein
VVHAGLLPVLFTNPREVPREQWPSAAPPGPGGRGAPAGGDAGVVLDPVALAALGVPRVRYQVKIRAGTRGTVFGCELARPGGVFKEVAVKVVAWDDRVRAELAVTAAVCPVRCLGGWVGFEPPTLPSAAWWPLLALCPRGRPWGAPFVRSESMVAP